MIVSWESTKYERFTETFTNFRATKDIRDKYVLSRLAWDLGILDELCELL